MLSIKKILVQRH